MIEFKWKYGLKKIELVEIFDENQEISEEEEDKEKSTEDKVEDVTNPCEYLFEMHSTKLMRKAIRSNDYDFEGGDICVHHNTLQKYFEYNKCLLSDIARTTETDERDIERRDALNRYIDFWRSEWNGNLEVEELHERTRLMLAESNIDNDVANKIEEYYREKSEYPPYYLFERLVANVSAKMVERRRLVKMIRFLVPYKAAEHSGSGEALTCQMVLSDTDYSKYITSAKTEIINDTENTINYYLSSTSISDSAFLNSVNHMIDCINSCDKGGNHNFGKFRGRNDKCYSIMDTDSETYISLSGTFDVTDRTILNYFNFSVQRETSNKSLKDKVNMIILNDPDLRKAKYAKMNLATERFPYKGGPFIPASGETVKDAIIKKVGKDEIGKGFSCCERKIFSYPNASFGGDSFLFARHKPCEKCKPAIKKLIQTSKTNIKIYHYENDVIKEFDVSTI